MTPFTARCSFRGCAVRYRDGDDRLCPLHRNDDDGLLGRMKSYDLTAIPGQRSQAGEAGEGGGNSKKP